MKRGWLNPDMFAGVGFAGFGLLMLWMGRDYQAGTALRMGPAYFPNLMALICVGLSFVLVVRSRWMQSEETPAAKLRAVAFVLAGIVAFALTIENLGLLIASALLVVLTGFARDGTRWRHLLALAAILSLLSAALFVWALGLPLAIVPR